MTFGTKNRPVLLIEGAPMGARIVPHKTDDTKLVLKGPPDYAMNLLAHMGIEGYTAISHGEGRGGFFNVEVDKAAFLAAVPGFLEEVLAANAPTADAPAVEYVPCEDCGKLKSGGEGVEGASCECGHKSDAAVVSEDEASQLDLTTLFN